MNLSLRAVGINHNCHIADLPKFWNYYLNEY
jgi:hypothetical protein